MHFSSSYGEHQGCRNKKLVRFSQKERKTIATKDSSVIDIYLCVGKDHAFKRGLKVHMVSGPHHRYIHSHIKASLYLGWTSKIIGTPVQRDMHAYLWGKG